MADFDEVLIRLGYAGKHGNKDWTYLGIRNADPVIPKNASIKERLEIMRKGTGRVAEWVSKNYPHRITRIVELPNGMLRVERQ